MTGCENQCAAATKEIHVLTGGSTLNPVIHRSLGGQRGRQPYREIQRARTPVRTFTTGYAVDRHGGGIVIFDDDLSLAGGAADNRISGTTQGDEEILIRFCQRVTQERDRYRLLADPRCKTQGTIFAGVVAARHCGTVGQCVIDRDRPGSDAIQADRDLSGFTTRVAFLHVNPPNRNFHRIIVADGTGGGSGSLDQIGSHRTGQNHREGFIGFGNGIGKDRNGEDRAGFSHRKIQGTADVGEIHACNGGLALYHIVKTDRHAGRCRQVYAEVEVGESVAAALGLGDIADTHHRFIRFSRVIKAIGKLKEFHVADFIGSLTAIRLIHILNQPGLAIAIEDDAVAFLITRIHYGIATVPAIQDVIPLATLQGIVTVHATQGIITCFTGQLIISRIAFQGVV